MGVYRQIVRQMPNLKALDIHETWDWKKLDFSELKTIQSLRILWESDEYDVENTEGSSLKKLIMKKSWNTNNNSRFYYANLRLWHAFFPDLEFEFRGNINVHNLLKIKK